MYWPIHWQITNIFTANYIQYAYYYYLYYNSRLQQVSIPRGSSSGSEYIKQLFINNIRNFNVHTVHFCSVFMNNQQMH
jgi:hypothetical protein